MASKRFWRFVGGLMLVGLVLVILSIVLVGGDFWQLRLGEQHWYRTFHF